jgi:ubiquinone/menaquinone biosynthesis C-methylase UbiE
LTHTATVSSALTFTGERFTPEVRGAILYEHWHRYAVVASRLRGLRVLDAACGEGYGSFLLAGAGARVTGIDISADAIAHARERYARADLAFKQGSVTKLPLENGSVDAVVSFETIEHLAEQRDMLAEFRRVLTPTGILVISSPNRPVYNEAGEVENHFHVGELDRAELKALLDPGFPQQAWYAQRVVAQSALWTEDGHGRGTEYLELEGDAAMARDGPAPALPALSLFDDGQLALWRDYARALGREKQLAWDEIDARSIAEDRLAELVAAVNMLASEKQAGVARMKQIAAMAASIAESQAAQAREVSAHAATREHLAYRESFRGWLRLPLSVLKRRMSGPR